MTDSMVVAVAVVVVSVVSLKYLDPQKPEKTPKGGAKILIKVKEGIETENAKKIVASIKESKIKVQASIQEMQVRISGKNRDDLQAAIAHIKAMGLELGLGDGAALGRLVVDDDDVLDRVDVLLRLQQRRQQRILDEDRAALGILEQIGDLLG